VALAEMAFGGIVGFDVDLATTGLDSPAAALSAEGGSRWIVECDPTRRREFAKVMTGIPVAEFGTVVGGPSQVRWNESVLATPDLAELYPRWRAGIGPL